MRLDRDRKKKLIVAFHFQFANRAGWNCESCRNHGLEEKRRCGFLPAGRRGVPRIVWGRKGVHTDECPKSMITGASLTLLEEFLVTRRLGIQESTSMEARKLEAFLILKNEMEREERDGTSQH